ncbi:MAG: hypothetical protein CENE_03571 [Candidatus Celerinatantimonas neptuna]|nr:MAG: hypothetical protein CENE_03571 [Candidatus Celerinatantimonas neptuna]
MNSKFIFIIAFFAIFLGIASLTGLFSPKHTSTDVKKSEPVEVTFYLTNQPVKAGQSFEKHMLNKHVMTRSQAIRLYGISDNRYFHFFKGMVARRNIVQGQSVTQQDFSVPQSSDYLALITPKDKIAYPIAFNLQQVDVMKIHTNEFVNVMLLSSSKGTVNAEPSSFKHVSGLTVSPLLRHVKVLTVNHDDKNKSKMSVVLALSQKQIAKTIIAQRIGKLYIFRINASGTFAYGEQSKVTVRDVIPGYVAVKELRGKSFSVDNAIQER